MKKYKKSSDLLGKKLVLYSTIMAGILTITGVTVTSCTNIKGTEEEYFDSVEDNRAIILDKPESIYNNDLSFESNTDQARKILANLKYNVDDEEIKQEIIDDNINLYLEALEKVNESSYIKDFNAEEYAYSNFETLHGENRLSDTVLIFNALAYQRIVDNNIDINDALVELNNLMVLQIYPSEIDEALWEKTFKNLLSTLGEEESIYDIYFPLAYDLHNITCFEEHEKDGDIITCDELEDDYKVFIK